MTRPDCVIAQRRIRNKAGHFGEAADTPALAAAESPAVGVARGGLADIDEDAPDLLLIGPAAPVEMDAAVTAGEQRGAEMVFQHADAVGDGRRGDAELLGGKHETLVPGGGLEESQAVERRQGNHGTGHREPEEWR